MQHNCHDAHCKPTGQPFNLLNLAVSQGNQKKIIHQPLQSYIINSGALYNQELHRQVASIPVPSHTPQSNLHAIQEGLSKWNNSTGPVHGPPHMAAPTAGSTAAAP